MHDYKLAEEYCDGIYQESNSTSLHGMHQLPASLQSRLKGVASQGWGAPGGPGSDMYLLLIQVQTEQQPCLVLPEPTCHNLAKCVVVLCKLTRVPEYLPTTIVSVLVCMGSLCPQHCTKDCQTPLALLLQALLQQNEAAFSEAAGQSGDGQEASQMSARWQEVAQLLGRKHDRIDSVQALPLLPLQVSIFAHCIVGLAIRFQPDVDRLLVGCMKQCEQAAR